MSSSQLVPLVMFFIGATLLAAPAGIVWTDIGAPTYEYEAVEIEVEEGEVSWPTGADIGGATHLENIVCLDETRSCALERHVYEEGSLAVEATGFWREPYSFAYLDGSFYEVTHSTDNGTTLLDHEPVSAPTALRLSSTTYEAAHPTYRAAVGAGTTTADHPLETPHVITTNAETEEEAYYLVSEAASPGPGEHTPGWGDRFVTLALSVASFLLGLTLLTRAERIRSLRRWRRRQDMTARPR